MAKVLLSVLAASTAFAAPSLTKRWYPESIGANYFQTNGFNGNQLVSSYIMPDGSLQPGTAAWTNGNGSAGINDPAPFENHPDPFYSSGSVVVVGNQVLVVNAGSDTFSVFDIDNEDPARPTLNATHPTGSFPISIAASADGNIVCVLSSGTDNGFKCYTSSENGWSHSESWDRSFGLNLTTPPHGPVGGTPSQILFASDMSYLFVAIKGRLPTDLNNPTGKLQPGGFWAYALDWVNGTWTLSPDYSSVEAPVPFSIAEDMYADGLYFSSDVSSGYDVSILGTWGNSSMSGSIPNSAAACWAEQSPLSHSFYVVDTVGLSNITEVYVDPKTQVSTILSANSVGVNASATDLSIFSHKTVDWLYVNAPAFNSVFTYSITGPGTFSLAHQWDITNATPDGWNWEGTLAGQAVYTKWW